MSSQIQITGGAKVRSLEGVITGTSGILNSVPLGAANGVATLDAYGKVPLSQLPASVVTYLGTWNAATNTPTLANGTGDIGDLYICNVAGTVNFGSGPITFAVGDWVIYNGTSWQKSAGQNGTVTSVAASITGNSVGITGSPITTAGTLAFAFAGTNLQYVNGAGNLTTFPTLITSIGLSMPSAFNVANSPLTANGTIAVTGAGTANQYIRGDGALATFPSTGGGGSAVYYYLNGSIAASVTGYKQMANVAVVGAGTDFSLVGNGLIAQFLTDAGNPNRLLIPSGAWNFEMFFSMSSSGGNQKFYLELLKYDGTTFTTIASNSANPEEITGGTTTDLYITSVAVPETTLLVTDRLAVRVYIVDNSVGRTTTLHTEDNNLCQVTTTFSSGIAALNGLTANTQYFATGTSGTDFNISSVLDTHTFNIPTASATKRGLLSSADWSTFNGKVPYTGATGPVNLGAYNLTVNTITIGAGNNSTLRNTFIGYQAGVANNTGQNNIALGYLALGSNSSGVNNIAIGNSTGYSITSGSYNTIIGTFNGTSALNYNVVLADGYGTVRFRWNGTNILIYGATIIDNSITATSFIKTSGTSSQFLKADGSVDSTSYQPLLTNPITGSGTRTVDYFPIFSAANTITNSGLFLIGSTLIIPNDVQIGYDGSSGNLQVRQINVNNDSSGGITLFKFGVGQKNALTTDGFGTSLVLNGNSAGWFSNVLINPNGGNVGIGTTAATTYKLQVNGTLGITGAATFSNSVNTSGNFIVDNTGGSIKSTDAGSYVALNGATSATPNTLIFGTSASPKMTITSGGNVGIGTSSPNRALEILSTSTQLRLAYDATTYSEIRNDSSGGLLISAGNSYIINYTSGVERMRITSGGVVGIGDTGNSSFKLSVTGPGGGVLANSNGPGDANFLSNSSAIGRHFMALSGASTVFYVASSGQIYSTSTSIISISDINYKENIKPLETGLSEIMALKPSRFDWKEGRGNGKKNIAGFIAQDLETVLPDLVEEYEKELGSTELLKGIKMTDLIPTLVKAIQEQQLQIEELKKLIK